MFYLRFKKKNRKNEQIAHFRSFPLFWWVMWVNRSFRSNQMSDVSELLRSLTKNERCERIPQRKWVIMSKSLRSLTKNERISESLVFLSELLIRSLFRKKRAIRSEIRWANSQPWCVSQTRAADLQSFWKVNVKTAKPINYLYRLGY